MCPPRIRFLTRIYHPNIDRLGRICLDVLKNNWSPALQIRTILLSIQALLGAPNPEDPLNEAVAKQWKVRSAHPPLLNGACSSTSNTSTGEPAGGHQNRTRVDTAVRPEEMSAQDGGEHCIHTIKNPTIRSLNITSCGISCVWAIIS
jgi:hypothetical protein